jgi:predicted secreted hydrolase
MDSKRTLKALFKAALFLLMSVLIVILSLPGRGKGEGFAYKLALPGREFSFPADHYSHPDFQTEWWYYTGHLQGESGKRYGYQVTFFRFGLRDRQQQIKDKAPLFTELYMAHFALSDVNRKKFVYRERINRGYQGRADAATDRYLVWNEDWKVTGDAKNHSIQASDRGTELRLQLTSLKPPVLHGENGLSQKGEGEGRASYYYSLTRMSTEGELTIEGKKEQVRGVSWMDHEFGSNQLGESQIGWDWFSLQLSDDTELMVYRIRQRDGTIEPASGGTWIRADGSAVPLPRDGITVAELDHWQSPQSRGRYPARWRLTVPSAHLAVELVPTVPQQELLTHRSTQVTYWEGSVTVAGERAGRPVMGLGYVELTGYAAPLRRRL